MERPKPAVGQVWRTSVGSLFLLTTSNEDGKLNFVCQSCDVGIPVSPSHIVDSTDTYVGQFRGFKVEVQE